MVKECLPAHHVVDTIIHVRTHRVVDVNIICMWAFCRQNGLSRNIWTPEIFDPPEQIFQSGARNIRSPLKYSIPSLTIYIHGVGCRTAAAGWAPEPLTHLFMVISRLSQYESHASLSETVTYRESSRSCSRVLVGSNAVPAMSWELSLEWGLVPL